MVLDLFLWIGLGAIAGWYGSRRSIARRLEPMLQAALDAKLSPEDWKRTKARLSSYRLGLYMAGSALGMLAGAAIWGVGAALSTG